MQCPPYRIYTQNEAQSISFSALIDKNLKPCTTTENYHFVFCILDKRHIFPASDYMPLFGAEAPGKDYSDPASQEIFISSTSGTLSHSLICLSIGSPNGLQENPNTFSSYQKLCQINALAMEKVMQSKACVFWSYPINRLTKG